MKTNNLGFLSRLIALLILCSLSLFASIGKITAINGQVSIERAGKTIEAKSGIELNQKDTIKSKASSNAQLVFSDQTVITVGPNSTFSIEEYINDDKNPSVKFKAGDGAFKAITGKIGKLAPDKFKVETKTATIGIRGTRLIIISMAGIETYACTKGTITATPRLAPVPPIPGATGQQQQQEPVVIIIKSGQMTTASGGQIQPARPYTPAELKQLEKSTESALKTVLQDLAKEEGGKQAVVVLGGGGLINELRELFPNVDDIKDSDLTDKAKEIISRLTGGGNSKDGAGSTGVLVPTDTTSIAAQDVSPYMALAKDIDSMSPTGVGQTRTIVHAGVPETFTMSYYDDDGVAYAWSREVNTVDEFNNPMTTHHYITSLDMVGALRNHVQINSQSNANVMIYLPSFSEEFPFYAYFNGMGFLHDYPSVPLELSKIGKTIAAADASTLVGSFIIRSSFADGYTYTAVDFDLVKNRWTMENIDAGRTSYLTTFSAIRPLALNPNMYTANLKGVTPGTHTPFGEVVVFEALVPQALTANSGLQNKAYIYTQYGSNGSTDPTKLGNNIFVKTSTDSLAFVAANGMFSNQGSSLVQGGSVVAGQINNSNVLGGLHFDMLSGASSIADVALAHGNDQYLGTDSGGPAATSEELAYLIHKNSDGTTEVYRQIASDLNSIKAAAYGWGFAGSGTAAIHTDTMNGFMSGYETFSGKYFLNSLSMIASTPWIAITPMNQATDGMSNVIDSNRIGSVSINTPTATSGSFISEDIQAVILKGSTASTNGMYTNNGSFIYYDTAFATLPDRVSGSTLEYVDDASAWGYWLAREATTTTSNIATGFWVAGIETSPSVLESYRTATTVANYSGHVLGNLDNGGIKDTIKLDASNYINFNVGFGSANPVQLTSVGFTTVGGTSISGSGITTSTSMISGVNPSTTAVGANNFQGTASWNSGTSNMQYYGKFFGPEANSMGGNWVGWFNSGATKGIGVFKAGRTN